MNPAITLSILLIVGILISYFLLLGLAKLAAAIAENSGKSLKGICVFCTLIGLSFIWLNQDQAPHLLEQVIDVLIFWDDPIPDGYGTEPVYG